MGKPPLTADRLVQGGFTEAGRWELNSVCDLAHAIDLPRTAGVYAFLIDGVAQYVGLASKSLHQRLGFYRKPGVSQRTNIRLNEVIRGHLSKGTVVQIFTAQPKDFSLGGFTIKGAEGLEAGLIEQFNLPWNMRGTIRKSPSATARQASRRASLADEILSLVRRQPGLSELGIAKSIFGPSAIQQQVNQDCRLLINRRLIERRGAGGRADPFTYHPMPMT